MNAEWMINTCPSVTHGKSLNPAKFCNKNNVTLGDFSKGIIPSGHFFRPSLMAKQEEPTLQIGPVWPVPLAQSK